MLKRQLFILFILIVCFHISIPTFLAPHKLNKRRNATIDICWTPAYGKLLSDSENTIECGGKETIKIILAINGIKNNEICPSIGSVESETLNDDCDEQAETTDAVKKLCEKRRKCKINVNDVDLPTACPGEAFQLLRVVYECNSVKMIFHPFAGNSYDARPYLKGTANGVERPSSGRRLSNGGGRGGRRN